MVGLAGLYEYCIFSTGLMLLMTFSLFLAAQRLRRLDEIAVSKYLANQQAVSWADFEFAISRRERFGDVSTVITYQVADKLAADFSAMYRLYNDSLEVIALFNLPKHFLGHRLPLKGGCVGAAVTESEPQLAINYPGVAGDTDLPMAKLMFGTAIAVPIYHGNNVYVVLVARGLQGEAFGDDDVQRLNALIPQFSVLIANSALFEQQAILNQNLQDEKGQLETVVTSTQNPVIAVDRSLRLIFINPAALELVELLNGDNVDGVVQEYGTQTDRPLQHDVIRKYLPGNTKNFIKALRKEGQYSYEIEMGELTYDCHVTSLGQPESAVGWVAILNDITGLKELDRFKSQMVRMTSHDLKNPLFAAMSYLDLLQDELDGLGLSEQTQTYTDTIMHQFARMNRTISSILDLERVESGLNAQEICEISPIIHRVIEEWRDQLDANNLMLEISTVNNLPAIMGDHKHLAQMFTNLLENAIKFTPTGGRILVELSEDKEGVILNVTDTGIGIPFELQERVFERFFRAQQVGTEHVGGSGLGLSLVRSIVKLHDGKVSLDSIPNEGTTVSVWLPEYRER